MLYSLTKMSSFIYLQLRLYLHVIIWEKSEIISKAIYLFHSVSHSFHHSSTLLGENLIISSFGWTGIELGEQVLTEDWADFDWAGFLLTT